MWVYTTKRDLQGKILKYKARLVVMGNLLPTSEELFAPTTSMDNIRLLLSIAAGNNWHVVFRDIAAAFLGETLVVKSQNPLAQSATLRLLFPHAHHHFQH